MCFLAPFEIFGICACLLLVNWFNSVQFAGSYAKNQPRSFHNGESNLNRNCEITLRNVNTCWISTVLFVLFSISCDTVIISTRLPFVIFHSKKFQKYEKSTYIDQADTEACNPCISTVWRYFSCRFLHDGCVCLFVCSCFCAISPIAI